MSNQQILEKAISKAIDGGWKFPWVGELIGIEHDLLSGEPQIWYRPRKNSTTQYGIGLWFILFNHDFAKALWGEQKGKLVGSGRFMKQRVTNIGWQYHLQQMVIADDPIKYLGEHLDD